MHDLAVEHLVVDDLAVELDFALVQHFDANFLAAVFLGVVLLDVLAGEETGQFHGDATLFHLVDDDDAEQTVVDLCVGADGHSAADAGAVADAYHEHALIHGFAVDGDAELVPFDMGESVEERGVILDFAVKRLHLGVADEHIDIHARAGDIEATAAADIDVVDIARFALEDDIHCVLDLAGMTGRADEIVAGAAGDYAEGDIAEVGNAVQHLVEGAVAAEDDELDTGFFGELRGDFRRMTGALGVVDLVLLFVVGEYLLDLFQCLQALTLASDWVDDYIIHRQISRNVRIYKHSIIFALLCQVVWQSMKND